MTEVRFNSNLAKKTKTANGINRWAERAPYRCPVGEDEKFGRQTPGLTPLPEKNPPGANVAAHGEKKICKPRVSVQRDGSRVTHLRIQCTCGQTLDLACLYDDEAT